MSRLFFLFLFVFVDILGFSIVLPLLPYLSQQYGLTPTAVGFLQASNAMAQLVAVPIIGSLSDQYGRKPLLLICVFATFVSFLILANAKNVIWVFFSRILDGLVGGNISLAQAYIADITSKDDRAKGMGYLGAAFGIGFIVGPALGGFLVSHNYQYPAYSAVILSFFNFIGLFFLPESLPPNKRRKTDDKSHSAIFKNLMSCVNQRRVALILWLRFLYLIVFTMFESGFSYFNLLRIELTPQSSSYLLCFYGVMFSAVQGGGMKYLKKRYSDSKMMSFSIKVLFVFYLLYSFITKVWQQMVILVFLGVCSGIMSTLITTRVSQEVEPTLIGGALGVSAALGSLSRIVAPATTGFLIDYLGSGAPFITCSLICLYLVTIEAKLNNNSNSNNNKNKTNKNKTKNNKSNKK